MKKSIFSILLAGALLLMSCDDDCDMPCGAILVNAGDTVEIISDAVYWSNEGEFGLEYVELKDDSRCPVNVNCVWEGDATVVFNMICVDDIGSVELHHNPGFVQSASVKRMVVKLIGIIPEKFHPDTLSWSDYHPLVTFIKE